MGGPSRRLPALDGLRAISITLVLIAHLRGTAGYPTDFWLPHLDIAEIGVGVFFVISGFLITTLLLEERRKSGTISLSGFYIRRAFRIFPASYAYVGVIALLALAGVVQLGRWDLLHAATYTTNYDQRRAWWVGQLWSLSVEEQFYLLWPALMLLLGKRRAMVAAAVGLALAPVSRVAITVLWPSHISGVGEYFPTVCDGLATGCLLAGLRPWLERHRAYLAFVTGPGVWLVLAATVALIAIPHRYILDITIVPLLLNTSIALVIDHCLRTVDRPFVRVLESLPFVWLGRLSYSLYLWQQPFLNRFSSARTASFPLNLALALGTATISYHAIEQPFLRLRARRAA